MTASLSNDDLDKLALESDARAGERVLAQLYEFLSRFVSLSERTCAGGPRVMVCTCSLNGQMGINTATCVPLR